MDCIRIIHISDLHFGEDKLDIKQKDKLTKFYNLLATMRKNASEGIKFHVVITGDFLDKYDRDPSQHEANALLFKKFLLDIIKYGNIPPNNFVFCLGNHDKSQNKYVKFLDKLRKTKTEDITYYERINGLHKKERMKISKSQIDDNLINQILNASNNEIFFNPYKCLGTKCQLPRIGPKTQSFLTGVKVIDKIKYISLNSSWFCTETIPTKHKNAFVYVKNDKEEEVIHRTNIQDHGNLSLGKEITRKLLRYSETINRELFTVGLIHHNIRSLGIDNHHDLAGTDSLVKDVYKTCSILLSGHEHGELDSDLSGLVCYTSCSGTFYSKEDSVNGNTFTTIDILFDTQRIKKTIYKYNTDSKEWVPVEKKRSDQVGDFLEFPKIVTTKITNHKIASNEYYLRIKNNVLTNREFYGFGKIRSATEFLADGFDVSKKVSITDFDSLVEANTLQAYVERHSLVRSRVFKKIYENGLRKKVTWVEPFDLS